MTTFWRKSSWQQYLAALAMFMAVTLLNLWLHDWIGHQAIALVYLLSVVLIALFVDRGPILFGTVLSATGWCFFHAPPRFSFQIAGFYDKMMLATYFVVAMTIGYLTTQLREQKHTEKKREECTAALYHLTRELANAGGIEEILGKSVQHVDSFFHLPTALSLPRWGETSGLAQFSDNTWRLDDKEISIVRWVYEHNRPAGRGTDILPEAGGIHLPLGSANSIAAVLSLKISDSTPLTPQQRGLLENFAQQIGLALDRQRWRDAEVKNKLLAESERLGRTLLNSVSHELRTPASAIASAASGLRSSGTLTAAQENLTVEIESAGARLNRVIQSLLSAARVQSGQLRPKLELCDVADLVQVALCHTSDILSQHPVQTRIAAELPLVQADFVLLEQALDNLLVNAATHTPPGTPIEVSAWPANSHVILEVADQGTGLPPEQLERIFDVFHRAPDAKPGGTGLGLAIVKGFVEAQGGRVTATNRPGGGAAFSIELPAFETPLLPEENA